MKQNNLYRGFSPEGNFDTFEKAKQFSIENAHEGCGLSNCWTFFTADGEKITWTTYDKQFRMDIPESEADIDARYSELQPVSINEASVKVMIGAAISQADNYHLYRSMALVGITGGSYREKADYGRKELTVTLYERLVNLLFLNRGQPNTVENGLAALSALYRV